MEKRSILIGDDGRITEPAVWIKPHLPKPYIAFSNKPETPILFPPGRYNFTFTSKGFVSATGMDPRLMVVYRQTPSEELTPKKGQDLVCWDTPYGRI